MSDEEEFGSMGEDALDALYETGAAVTYLVSGEPEEAVDSFLDASSSALDAITGGGFSHVVDRFEEDTGIDTREVFQDGLETVGNELGEAAYEATEFVGEVYDDVSEYAGEIYDDVSDVASEVYDTASEVYDTASDVASEVYDTASDVAGEVYDTASDVAGDVYDAASEAYDTVAGWLD